MKKIFATFSLSFFLNLVWENAHASLYDAYKGKEITEAVLLHATLADAVYLTVIIFFLRMFSLTRMNLYTSISLTGIVLAIGIERWALITHRWAYNVSMPILPLLNVGLSPTIQLAITGCVTYWFIFGRVQKS